MAKIKKTPQRMCLGCGEMKPKKELIRIVKNSLGEISLDFTGKAAGRGAYICRNEDCLARTVKTKRLERAFEAQIPEEVYSLLSLQLAAASEKEKDE